jgi:cell division protein FtsB
MKSNKFLKKYLKKYSYNLDTVVGIDTESDELFLMNEGIISKITKKEVNPEHLLSSYIPNKNVITYEFKMQKNLLDKVDLNDYVETKCYEDVGLDEAEEYIFKYKIIDTISDDKNVMVEVIIIAKKDFKSFYEPIVKDYGYIDYITYSGFVFNALYLEKILEPQNDLYIFFTKDEIIITIYSEGKFLQTSVIPEGLESIYNDLMETLNIKNFEFSHFMELVVKKGLNINNYVEKEQILFNEFSEFFSNKFLMISNQIHEIIRKFSLTTIDRIFMGTPRGVIPGINEFANMYLGVEANDLKFDLNYNPYNVEIDQMLFLSMLYARYAYKKSYQVDNFTIFHRPPTFFYRKSGQFISITVASIVLSAAYPLYQMTNTYIINSQNKIMQKELNSLKKQNNSLKRQNNSLKKKRTSKLNEQNNLKKYILDREKIIEQIYIEKKGYVPKAALIAKLVKYLMNNNVYLKNISYGDTNQNMLVLKVYAKDNKNITNFIDSVVKSEHLVITTPGYQKSNDFYTADIMIKVEK